MKILKRLAIKNLKMNRKRTVSTIIGIILSTALICGTATLVSSFQNTLVQNAINEMGYYHLKLSNLNNEEVRKVQEESEVKRNF